MANTFLLDALHFGRAVGYKDGERIQRFAAGVDTGILLGKGTSGSEVRPTYVARAVTLSGYGGIRLNAGATGIPTMWLEAEANTTGQTTLAQSAHTMWFVFKSSATVFCALMSKVTSGANASWVVLNKYPSTNDGKVMTYNAGAESGDINDGALHVVILSVSGANQRMMVDGGAVITSAAGPAGRASSSVPLKFGAFYSASYLYGGDITLIAAGFEDDYKSTDPAMTALNTAITNRYINGNTRCIGAVGDSITAGAYATGYPGSDANAGFTKLVSQLTASTGQTWSGVNMGVPGSNTGDWLPGTANYIAARDAFAAAGCTYISLMLGTNDTINAQLTPAATFGSRLRQIVEGFRADLPCLTGIMIHYPCSAWNTGGGGDALMQTYFPYIDAICNDAFYAVGDKAAYDVFRADSATYKPGDDLHPNQTGHDYLANVWEARFLAAFNTGVGAGRIAVGSPTSTSVAIISAIDPVSYAAPGATIASCGAQYSTNGGSSWNNATWAAAEDIYSGVASGLPAGTTHVRRKATDSLGNISYTDKIAVTLSSGGGGGSKDMGSPVRMFDDPIPYTASDSALVTDTVSMTQQCGFYVVTGGAVAIISARGNARTITLQDGEAYYGRVRQILSTGTTATGIWLMAYPV